MSLPSAAETAHRAGGWLAVLEQTGLTATVVVRTRTRDARGTTSTTEDRTQAGIPTLRVKPAMPRSETIAAGGATLANLDQWEFILPNGTAVKAKDAIESSDGVTYEVVASNDSDEYAGAVLASVVRQ